MHAKIPVTILSGFLGAGKTTLVQSLLAQAGEKKIALIINEFGTKGVDADLIKGCGDQACAADALIELANGCICCTVADDFIPTMTMLLARNPRPDHIIIETSGLALPQPLIKAFNWPEIKADVMIDGVITLVDGDAVARGQFAHDESAVDAQRRGDDSLDHETPLSELFEDQLSSADLVVMTKTDLLQEKQITEIQEKIATQLRDGVPIVKAANGQIDAGLIMGLEADSGADKSRHHARHHHHHDGDDHHHEHDHDDFKSFVVPLAPIDDRAAFERQLQQLLVNHQILRLKGFANMGAGGARLVIQAVGPRLSSHFEAVPAQAEQTEGHLVVIGLENMDQVAITQALETLAVAA